jgi:energy-converting hydrogenase A subunit M
VSEKSELWIRAAAMNCLARCLESDIPLCCLADFLHHLRAIDWSDHAIRQVEAQVLAFMRCGSIPPTTAAAA